MIKNLIKKIRQRFCDHDITKMPFPFDRPDGVQRYQCRKCGKMFYL